jgi:hypothetical protein
MCSRPREVDWLAGIAPQALKPRSLFSRHGQAQDWLDVSCIVIPQGAHGQYLMVKRGEGVMHLLTHHCMAKHAHQVVSEHRHAQRCLRGPEVA